MVTFTKTFLADLAQAASMASRISPIPPKKSNAGTRYRIIYRSSGHLRCMYITYDSEKSTLAEQSIEAVKEHSRNTGRTFERIISTTRV